MKTTSFMLYLMGSRLSNGLADRADLFRYKCQGAIQREIKGVYQGYAPLRHPKYSQTTVSMRDWRPL